MRNFYNWPKQPISRVLFPRQVTLSAGDGHSSGTAVTDGLKQPTRKHGRAVLDASLFGLAPGGVYLASGVTVGPGELLPHPFTLTCLCLRSGRRTSLCGTFPGVTPAGRYPAPCPLEPGLSSPLKKGAAICSTSAKLYLRFKIQGSRYPVMFNVELK